MANNHLTEKEMLEDLENEYEREKAHRRKYPKGMTLLEYVLLTKEKCEQRSYFECLHENYGSNLLEQNTSLISRIITNRFFKEENINLEVLDLLVENGANVNDSKGEYGHPLLASICFKKEKIFDWLVEREDIDLTAHDNKGNALHKLIGEWNNDTKLRVERMLENFMQKAHSKGCLHDLQEQKSKMRDLKPCKTDTEKDVLHKRFEDLSKQYEKRDKLYIERKINNVLKELFNGDVSCPVDRSKLEEIISKYCRCPDDVSTCEENVVYEEFEHLIKKLCNSMKYEMFKRVFEEDDGVFQNFITDIKSIKKGEENVRENKRDSRKFEASFETATFENNQIENVIVYINQVTPSPSDQLPLSTCSPTIPTPTNPAPANNAGSGKLAVESTDQTDNQNQLALVAKEQQSASDPSMKSPEKELALRQSELENPSSMNTPEEETQNRLEAVDFTGTTGNRNDDNTDRSTQIETAQIGNKAMESISGGGYVTAEPVHRVTEAFTEFQEQLFKDRFRVVVSMRSRDGPPPRQWDQDEIWSDHDYVQNDTDNEL